MATKAKKPVVLVRTFSAGVHFGALENRKGKEVVLTGARRIWFWKGANTLHEIALHGVSVSGSKVSEAVPEITLTEAIEVIPMAVEAVAAMGSAKWT